MNSKGRISETWIKASVIGTTWAASEIVLGSFLHNLKIPFSSNVLTAIGIIILISSSYKWTEKGLFWRAGLICAFMKTMSPSAVIIGPMVAIFSQAFLLEITTRMIGRNIIGFFTGAMLAMTWNLFHKIMNFVIAYGFNILNVYSDLLKYAQKQLNIHVDLVWSPILILVLIYCLLGVIAAIIGMKVGHKLANQLPVNNHLKNNLNDVVTKQNMHSFNYSLYWLFIDVAFIITAFILLNRSAWFIWSSAISVIVVIWIFRYKRALRQLSRPRFWIYFVMITMITAFVVNKIQSQDFVNGLQVGIQMNFRALIVILGFSVIGTELYNEKIRVFFLKTWFKQLPLALEMSFKSLPLMIATVPEFKVIIKNPVNVIFQVISQIEFRLQEMKNNLSAKVFIITGAIGEGKTTQVQKVIEELKSKNIKVGGIVSPRIMDKDITTGYDVLVIENNNREPFLRRNSESESDKIGNFSISEKGLQMGVNALSLSNRDHSEVIVIDEIGRLELENRGWSSNLTELLNNSKVLLITIRDNFVDQVIQKWDLKNYSVHRVTKDLNLEISKLITNHIN